VLQPKSRKKREDKVLKYNIKCYYFKEMGILRNRFIHFVDFNPFFIVQIIKILKQHKIHLIHVDYPYGINIIKLITSIPISYNAYNVETSFWKQIAKKYKKIPFFLRGLYAKFIYILEKTAIKFATNINAISFYDKILFIKIFKIHDNKIFTNRMGLNEEIFRNTITQKSAKEKLNIDENKFVVIFHGSYYNNIPNREAIQIIREEIVPQVRDEDILFMIAGKMPFFKNERNLRFLGFVNNLTHFLCSADVAIVPVFRGTGIKVKVIDYLSAMIPVIITKQAVKGLHLKNDVHGYVVGDDNPIEEMIDKVLNLKKDCVKLKEYKTNIQKLLESKYNWERILMALERRYRDIIIRNNI